MPNRLKETMEYWPHSNYLFHDLEMRKLRAKCGLVAYTTYCYLMEQISRDINKPLLLDEETKLLAMDDLRIDEESFNKIINTMLNLQMFNKDLYCKDKMLSNNEIENVKKNVMNLRANNRKRKENSRHVTRDNKEGNINKENDNVLYKDKLSKDKLSKDKLSKDNIIIVINGTTITTKIELYNTISSLLNTKELNQAQINLIDKMYNENSKALSKAIETCQISANGTINMNYISKAYETAKNENSENLEPNRTIQETKEDIQNNIDEAEELEKLKEARRTRKAQKGEN